MQVVENTVYVRSKVRLGNIAHYVSLALLGIGFGLSLLVGSLGTEAIWGAYAAMIAALLLLSYGRTFTRRFGARFRQDQWLVSGLKGLDNRHTLYNYAAPDLPDHILIGPTGLYVLVPRPNGGTIRFDGSRWTRGSVAGGLLRGIAEGGLGNPMNDVRNSMAQLAAYLRKNGSEELIQGLEGRPIIVFTNPRADLEVRNSPISVVGIRELKAIFRRSKATLDPEKAEELKRVVGREVTQ